MSKKAQNITNIYTIIVVIVIVASFGFVTLKFGQDLASDPDTKLNDESLVYVFERSGFTTYNVSPEDTTVQFYTSEAGSEGSLKDQALEFRFFQENSGSFRAKINTIWNVPSFLFQMLNLPMNTTFQVILNIWNLIIWSFIAIGVWRLIRGNF